MVGGWVGGCIWIIASALVPFWDSLWDLSFSKRCMFDHSVCVTRDLKKYAFWPSAKCISFQHLPSSIQRRVKAYTFLYSNILLIMILNLLPVWFTTGTPPALIVKGTSEKWPLVSPLFSWERMHVKVLGSHVSPNPQAILLLHIRPGISVGHLAFRYSSSASNTPCHHLFLQQFLGLILI